MTIIADFKEQIALRRIPGDRGYCAPRSIIRTPGTERRVTLGDLRAARVLKGPEPSSGGARPCALRCGTPAANGSVLCDKCLARFFE